MDDEHEKLRMKETTFGLPSLRSSLNLGSQEIPIKEYVQLAQEVIVDPEYIMYELVNLACRRQIHLGLDLSEEPKGNDVDDQSIPIVNLPQACEHAQLLSQIVVEHPLEFSIVDVTNMQSFMD